MLSRSSSADSAIKYANTSGFVDDVMFSHNGANGSKSSTTLCFVEFARWRYWVKSDVYDCALLNWHNINKI